MKRLIYLFSVAIFISFSTTYSAIDTSKSTFYLYSYFEDGSAGEAAGTFLLISNDGINWDYCNNKKPIITPSVGSAKLMRDPCLFYAEDGAFHLVWTTGWTGKDIGYASSRDLITWNTQKALSVMSNYPNTAMCWAPEIFYNDLKKEYMIYWSSDPDGTNVNGDIKQTFYVTTKDFVKFSEAKKLFNQSYSEIDATLLKTGDSSYTLFFKDERINDNRGRIIYYVTSSSPEGPWSAVSSGITKRGVEGPTAIKIGNEYRVYFDPYSYSDKKYRYVKSTNLKDWSDGTPIPFSFRHGTILKISKDVALWLLYKIPIPSTETLNYSAKKYDPLKLTEKKSTTSSVNSFNLQGQMIKSNSSVQTQNHPFPYGIYLITKPGFKTGTKKAIFR